MLIMSWPERERYTSVEGPDMTGFGSKRARNIAMDSMSSKRWGEKLDKETRVTRKRMHITKQSTLPLPEVVRNIKSAPSKQQVGAVSSFTSYRERARGISCFVRNYFGNNNVQSGSCT